MLHQEPQAHLGFILVHITQCEKECSTLCCFLLIRSPKQRYLLFSLSFSIFPSLFFFMHTPTYFLSLRLIFRAFSLVLKKWLKIPARSNIRHLEDPVTTTVKSLARFLFVKYLSDHRIYKTFKNSQSWAEVHRTFVVCLFISLFVYLLVFNSTFQSR